MGNCLQTSDSDDINLVHSVGEIEDGDDDLASLSSRQNNRVEFSRQDSERHRVGAPPVYDNAYVTRDAHQQRTPDAPVIFHPSPGVSRTACQLTEEEQIKIAQRIGLIQHLPVDIFAEASKTDKECIICMMEFCEGDHVRFLPCLHTFHVACIDDWLMRSFTCPSCLEPVDSALLTSYDQNAAVSLDGFGAGVSLRQQLDNLTSSPSLYTAQDDDATVVVVSDDGAVAVAPTSGDRPSIRTVESEDGAGAVPILNRSIMSENSDRSTSVLADKGQDFSSTDADVADVDRSRPLSNDAAVDAPFSANQNRNNRYVRTRGLDVITRDASVD